MRTKVAIPSLCLFLVSVCGLAEEKGRMSFDIYESLVKHTPEIRQSCAPIFSVTNDNKGKIEGVAWLVSEEGILVTAGHIAELPQRLVVIYRGTQYECTVLAKNIQIPGPAGKPISWDIGALSIELPHDASSKIVKLSHREMYQPGEPVALWSFYEEGVEQDGDTTTLMPLLTYGIVSGTYNSVTHDSQPYGAKMILNITGGLGSSGGPVFDPRTGEVIAIVSGGKARDIVKLRPGTKNEYATIQIGIGTLNVEPVLPIIRKLPEWRKRLDESRVNKTVDR